MNEKNVKTTKRTHAFKCYASSYNVGFLNSFNSRLQPKDTESAIKNKLKKLLTELRGFKFVTTCVLEFKKIEIDDKAKYGKKRQEQLLMKMTLMIYLNQSIILQLYQTYKNF